MGERKREDAAKAAKRKKERGKEKTTPASL
jgi:hypothetical protein